MQRTIVLRKALHPTQVSIVHPAFAHSTAHIKQPRVQRPRNTRSRVPQPSGIPKILGQSVTCETDDHPSTGSASLTTLNTSASENSLLSPVHVAEDPDGVLKERHPAAELLANSAIVVQRQLEIMNVLLGFEQANKYIIMDPQGNHLGYMAEREEGMRNTMARQWFRTHRSFTTHVFDKHEKEILRFHRPFSWVSSRIWVYDPLGAAAGQSRSSVALEESIPGSPLSESSQTSAQVSHLSQSDMRIIGEARQQWAPLRRKYNLSICRQFQDAAVGSEAQRLSSGDFPPSDLQHLQVIKNSRGVRDSGEYSQFAHVDEPFLSWDFSLRSPDSRLIGSVNRNFSGFGREIFTNTGIYALRMDAAGLADKSAYLVSDLKEQNDVSSREGQAGMTLDQRAVMLATAVSVDFDYFSRGHASGVTGWMPLWFPSGGETAVGGAAAGAAAGEVEGGAGAVTAVGNAAKGTGGMREGAAIGAGTMAGYEAIQQGTYGDSASPIAGPELSSGSGAEQPSPLQQQPGQDEEVWGESWPWGGGGNDDGSSDGSSSGGDWSGGGGDGWGGFF